MFVALGDLKKANCSFTFDDSGRLRLIFPDHSVILDKREGIVIFGGDNLPLISEAERWLKDH